MQPPDSRGSFRQYLTGRKMNEFMEAIGEVELAVTDENKHNGAIVLWRGRYYEVVDCMPWLNGVINHFEYLLFRMTEKDAIKLVG
ncbi:hypothetical protein HPU94_00285 [Kosakonia sacchari]|nr:hypothetical protein [Kosakonia sacchari]